MKRIPGLIVTVCAVVIGGLVGFHIASARYSNAVTSTIASYEFLNEADTFDTLRDLRAGKSNEMAGELEQRLDTGIISLNAILKENPAIEHAHNYTNLLRRIAEYRSNFPDHVDDTNLSSMAAEILTNVTK